MGQTLALGAVHGRYHYTADSAPGAIFGVVSFTPVSLWSPRRKPSFVVLSHSANPFANQLNMPFNISLTRKFAPDVKR